MHNLSLKTKIPLLVLVVTISILALAVFGARSYFRLPVLNYYSASEKAFKIPGLNSELVAQGLHYDEKNELYLVSAYSSDGDSSTVSLVDKASGELLKTIKLAKLDGSSFKGHAGGVACFDKYVYVAGSGDKCIYVFPYDEMLSAENGARVASIGSFSLSYSDSDYVKSSFLSVCDGKLITGEFYSEGNYKTLDTHKLTTKGGEYNCAIAVEYSLDPEYDFGISPTPDKAYSLPEKVQGIHIENGTIYFSISYGLAFSFIKEYRITDANDEGIINLLSYELPLYSFDSQNMSACYKLPPMSEEITVVDGKLIVMCESASTKYLFGRLTGGKWCYATDLSDMKSCK